MFSFIFPYIITISFISKFLKQKSAIIAVMAYWQKPANAIIALPLGSAPARDKISPFTVLKMNFNIGKSSIFKTINWKILPFACKLAKNRSDFLPCHYFVSVIDVSLLAYRAT